MVYPYKVGNEQKKKKRKVVSQCNIYYCNTDFCYSCSKYNKILTKLPNENFP